MDKEIECVDCGAIFVVDEIEESQETDTVNFCPYCGSEDIKVLEDDDGSFLNDDDDE